MTITLTIAILAAVGFAVIGAIAQAASGAVALLHPGRVHRLVENETRGAVALEQLVSARSRLRGTASLLGGFSFAASSVAAYAMIGEWVPVVPPWLAATIGGTLGTLLTYSIVMVLPRTFAVANAERVALEAAPPALALTRVVSPIARVLAAPWKWMLGLARGEEIPSPWSTGDEYFAASASD
ncbi:MAG: DUF21 domain-containing protein, partial [Coriobacteriales bacterium]|nr:DUF21 domain-containing protein [Coriobacteriales bacterium]